MHADQGAAVGLEHVVLSSLTPVVLELLQKLPNSTYQGSSCSSHVMQVNPGNTQVWVITREQEYRQRASLLTGRVLLWLSSRHLMQIIIPPLSKTRKMGSKSLQTLRSNENHSEEATRSRQHKAVLPEKNLTQFRLSFSYHTRLVLKFFYAPQDHAGFGNTAYKTHREEQVLRDIVTLQLASELPAKGKQREHNNLHLGTPPPFPGIKDKPPHKKNFLLLPHPARIQEQAFASRVFPSRRNSRLPDYIQEWYHQGATYYSQDLPAQNRFSPITKAVGISARSLWSLDIQTLSYKHYPAIAIYIEYPTESISVLNPSQQWLQQRLP